MVSVKCDGEDEVSMLESGGVWPVITDLWPLSSATPGLVLNVGWVWFGRSVEWV